MIIPSNFGRRPLTEQELQFLDQRDLLLTKATLEKEIEQLEQHIAAAQKRQEALRSGATTPRANTRKAAASNAERRSDALIEIDSYLFTMGLKLQQKNKLMGALLKRLV